MILAVSFMYEHHSLHLKGCNLETQCKHTEPGVSPLCHMGGEYTEADKVLSSCRCLANLFLLGDCYRDCYHVRDCNNDQLY